VDDSVIRAIASPRQQKLNQGSVYTDYGGQIDKTLPNIVTRATGDVGMAVGAIAAFPAMDVVRQALPMVLALLKMALVICIPLVLVVGTYDLKTVVTVSVVQFALFFTDFWFQLARWIDSTILDALYGWGFGWNRPHTNFDPLVGLNNAFGDMLLMFVMGTMFIVLPTFWVACAWAGRAFAPGTSSRPGGGSARARLLAAREARRQRSLSRCSVVLVVRVDAETVVGVQAESGLAVSPFWFGQSSSVGVAAIQAAATPNQQHQCQPEAV
jgi:hypothetical protein